MLADLQAMALTLCFYALNALLLYLNEQLCSGCEAPPFLMLTCTLQHASACGQKSRAEYLQDLGAHASECPALRKKHANPVPSH